MKCDFFLFLQLSMVLAVLVGLCVLLGAFLWLFWTDDSAGWKWIRMVRGKQLSLLDLAKRRSWGILTRRDPADLSPLEFKQADASGHTCFLLACLGGELHAAQWMLANGSSMEETNNDGENGFYLACTEECHSVIQWIIEIGELAMEDLNSCLLMASIEGHIEVAQLLCDAGANIDHVDKEGVSCFINACKYDNIEVAQLLATRGADIHGTDRFGDSEIFAARWYGSPLEVYKLFYEGGIDMNQVDEDGETILFNPHSTMDEVKWCLENGIDLYAKNNRGETCLFAACYAGNLSLVKYLIERGADIHATCNRGSNCLFSATFGSLEVIEWLLQSQEGLDVHMQDHWGDTCFQRACYFGKRPIIEYLMRYESNNELRQQMIDTGLPMACQGGNIEIAKLLYEKGAPLNQVRGRSTSMNFVCAGGYLEIAEWLFSLGADFTDPQNLLVACKNGHIDVAKWLLNNGANIESQCDTFGETGIHAACKGGRLDVVKWLKEMGINTSAVTNGGETPLHLACKYGSMDIIQWLMAEGADISAQSKKGKTCLWNACADIYHNLEVAQMLMSYGASIGIEENGGRSVMVEACKSGDIDMIQWLFNLGCSLSEEDKDSSETCMEILEVKGLRKQLQRNKTVKRAR